MTVNKKGQVIIEFVALFGVTIIIFLGVAAVIYQEKNDLILESESKNIQTFAVALQNELMIAATMSDGFSRTITLQETINGEPYAVQIISSNLYVIQEPEEIILPLPSINGTINGLMFTLVKNETGMYVQ